MCAQRYWVLQGERSADRLNTYTPTHAHTHTHTAGSCWVPDGINQTLAHFVATYLHSALPPVKSVVLMETIVRRFYSIANNTLTRLLPLVLEENQYNIWVQMANSHHRKCKLQGAGSSLLRCWSEHWTLNPQSWHPPRPLRPLYLSVFFKKKKNIFFSLSQRRLQLL